jgi:hypothetical protein
VTDRQTISPAFIPGTKVYHRDGEWVGPGTIEDVVVGYNVTLATGQGVGPLWEEDLFLASEVDIELTVGDNPAAIAIARTFVADLLDNEFDRGRWAIEEIADLDFRKDTSPETVISQTLQRFGEYCALSNSFWAKVGAWCYSHVERAELDMDDDSPITLNRPNYQDDLALPHSLFTDVAD